MQHTSPRSPALSAGEFISIVGVVVTFIGAFFSVMLAYLTFRRTPRRQASQDAGTAPAELQSRDVEAQTDTSNAIHDFTPETSTSFNATEMLRTPDQAPSLSRPTDEQTGLTTDRRDLVHDQGTTDH